MAAHKATVSVSASLLPDEIKTSIGGTSVYDLNDIGDNNKWTYSLTIVGASVEDALLASIPFLGQGTAEEGATATVNGTDDIVFLFVKHTGTTDGSTSTTANLKISLNGENAATAGVGNILIKPDEIWCSRLDYSAMGSLHAYSSSGSIMVAAYAIVEDGGI